MLSVNTEDKKVIENTVPDSCDGAYESKRYD